MKSFIFELNHGLILIPHYGTRSIARQIVNSVNILKVVIEQIKNLVTKIQKINELHK